MVNSEWLAFSICHLLFAMRYSLTQLLICRMPEKAVGQAFDAFLDAVPEPVAHPAALFD
ncbi:MAG: hypothetical protein J7M17_02735 [Anaerolineae bacterium]|nr:hypothetical protein [Anaerolineae bacterium]